MHVCICVRVHIFVYVCMSIFVCMCVFMYVYMYIFVYVSMCVYVHRYVGQSVFVVLKQSYTKTIRGKQSVYVPWDGIIKIWFPKSIFNHFSSLKPYHTCILSPTLHHFKCTM